MFICWLSITALFKTVFQPTNLDCCLGIVTLVVYITVLNNLGFFVGLERLVFTVLWYIKVLMMGGFECLCVFWEGDMWFFEPKYMVAQNVSNLSDKPYILWNLLYIR